LGSNEIRFTSDKNRVSQSDKKGKVKSKDSGSKNEAEKAKEYIGPGYAEKVRNGLKAAAVATLAMTAGMGGAMADQSRSLQNLPGSDNSTGLLPTSNQRGQFIGYNPPERYVPSERDLKQLNEFLEKINKPPFYFGPKDAQAIPSGETSQSAMETHQREQNKHKGMKSLLSNEENIATVRALMDKLNENPEALQSFKKMLNDKKVRERLLLESRPEIARVLQEQSDYTYTQLTSTAAHTELNSSQAFQEATHYLGKQPDWNNIYAYQSNNTNAKGIIAMYPSESQSLTFLAIDDPSAGNDTIGLLGQWAVQSEKQATLTWSTPQGKPFVAQILQDGNWTTEALVSGKINLGKFRFFIECFKTCVGVSLNVDCTNNCIDCFTSGFKDPVACIGCVDCAGTIGTDCIKQCLGTDSDEKSACHDPCSDTPASVDCIKQCTTNVSSDPSACLDVSISDVLAKVEPVPGLQAPNQQVRLNYTLSVQNHCPQTIKDVTYHIEGTGGCPGPSTFVPAPVSGVYIQSFSADPSSVAPGDSAGVKAGQDTSIISRCETYGWGFRITSSSLPPDLSVSISASGTDSITNSQIHSQKKIFQILGDSESPTYCGQQCPQTHTSSASRRLGHASKWRARHVLLRTGIPLAAYALVGRFR